MKVSLFWFRRDLRLEDNAGLYHALKSNFPVLPVFIFDTTILGKLDEMGDRRVDYIHQAVSGLNKQLQGSASGLKALFGEPLTVFESLLACYEVQAVFCNRDYESSAIERDRGVAQFLNSRHIPFYDFKDQVIFEKDEIVKNDGSPYTVFTPYATKWKATLSTYPFKEYLNSSDQFLKQAPAQILSLQELGFQKTDIIYKEPVLDEQKIRVYDRTRDFPALQGTSGLSMALRFGTISIRQCVKFALDHNQVWLNELIWREFFMQIFFHFPRVVQQSFKPKYDLIRWLNDTEDFQKWCQGRTGYPLVDAGMRQLNSTGYMHNRVRMVVASFLCKHLLIDWRWGEAYFAQKLNDYDLSANNGNWQWAAGSGCDAAPYFRIFNPMTQAAKFDKSQEYIKRWIPEIGTNQYPDPMIDHQFARERALKVYGMAQ